LYLSLAGLAGLSYYVYMEYNGANATAAKKALPPVTSALTGDWIETPLKTIEPYNDNTTKLTFSLPENTATLLPVAGCVLLQADESGPKDPKGQLITRPYTPISPSDKRGEVTFLIKKYDTGKLTPYLHNLKVGDKVKIKGPLQKIAYQSNEHDQIAMIAGGSGITPMYQVLDHALKIPEDKTKFKLIFANVTPADILLRQELDQFKKSHPDRFDVVYVVDKPGEGWTGPTGYISAALIKQHVASASTGNKVKVYICGPPGQVASIAGKKDGYNQGQVAGILKELGYTEDQVFKF